MGHSSAPAERAGLVHSGMVQLGLVMCSSLLDEYESPVAVTAARGSFLYWVRWADLPAALRLQCGHSGPRMIDLSRSSCPR